MRDKSLACGYLGLIGCCLGAASAVHGQQAPTTADNGPPASSAGPNAPADLQEVIITGYRRSLTESTEAKRDATGFIDQVNAEDIGKFPDTNIAESFNRIPGITISRDIDGEGTDISIRGLGTNFTKVLLNGAPVAVASTGTTDSQNTNREVDLDLFPTELFTQLTVKKTSSPEMIEGGAAGTVDMRSARPFDSPGAHFTYTAQGTKNQSASQWGERGAVIASDTWDNGFGALLGVASVANRINVTGFETIGWTNANLTTAQCGAGNTCNQTGGGNWTIPATVPTGAGNGLVAGTPINNAFLLAHNPGLTTQQIDNALIPRLGRNADEFGARDRGNAIVSLEYRPNDALHLYVDSMYGHKKNNEQRIDMDWVGRNGAAIPLNMTVDRSDCSNGCVATGGTFANAQSFLEYRPYTETVNFYGLNPGLTWQIADAFKMDVQGNKTNSTFHREVPSVVVSTPLGVRRHRQLRQHWRHPFDPKQPGSEQSRQLRLECRLASQHPGREARYGHQGCPHESHLGRGQRCQSAIRRVIRRYPEKDQSGGQQPGVAERGLRQQPHYLRSDPELAAVLRRPGAAGYAGFRRRLSGLSRLRDGVYGGSDRRGHL